MAWATSAAGHVGSDGGIKGCALVDGGNQLFADVLGQVLAHGIDVEHIFAVEVHAYRGGQLDRRGRLFRDFVDCLFAVAYAHLEPHFLPLKGRFSFYEKEIRNKNWGWHAIFWVFFRIFITFL